GAVQLRDQLRCDQERNGSVRRLLPNAVKRFSQYLEVYRIMLRNSLVREMNFKLNFILWLFTDALWFVGQLIFIEVIYAQVDAIGDWTKWDMVLLVGTYQIISQVFQGFFYLNLTNLSELVRTGRLVFVLLQPTDPQFTVSLRIDRLQQDEVHSAGSYQLRQIHRL